jgi:hypothetical protein
MNKTIKLSGACNIKTLWRSAHPQPLNLSTTSTPQPLNNLNPSTSQPLNKLSTTQSLLKYEKIIRSPFVPFSRSTIGSGYVGAAIT